MGVIIGAIKIIVVLGTLITIHELGHFLVAKACNVKIQKFSIGFGPKVLKIQGKETEYTLRLIPFGGFVQMEGEEERSEDDRAFNKKPIYQRILIVAAGATVNIIFALIVYCVIALNTNTYPSNVIKNISTDSAEYIAGLRSGDLVISVNGKNTMVAQDIDRVISKSKKDEFIFKIERDNLVQEVNLNIPITQKGFLGIMYNRDNTVVDILEESPVSKSGLRSGDILLKINDTVIDHWEKIGEAISNAPDEEVNLVVRRGNTIEELKVMTTSNTDRFYNWSFGIIKPEGFDKVIYAINETGDYFNANIEGIITMFTGKTENVEVMGPVGIADEIASTKGWSEFFGLMCAISLSLGIFNLFPIPALDGGKIILLIIEKIRKKPFEQKTEVIATLVGFGLIITLALIVTVSDVIGLF